MASRGGTRPTRQPEQNRDRKLKTLGEIRKRPCSRRQTCHVSFRGLTL
ncbi:hypothetical protein CCACVL1_03588 [Corchorus capsularis]|uniref:Uncharacterized protein n=1 Tax=Corchorus capsularis TaxID=210143 RepID=A0A1R3JYN7_COCAP|nr:hypothetical protein CCACVL1_03588 [Corchorus capsularis]